MQVLGERPKVVSMEVLSPLPICLVEAWAGVSCHIFHLHLLTSGAGGRADLVVIIVGELSWTPINHNTQENKPCNCPGQHNSINPVNSGVGEPAKKL